MNSNIEKVLFRQLLLLPTDLKARFHEMNCGKIFAATSSNRNLPWDTIAQSSIFVGPVLKLALIFLNAK